MLRRTLLALFATLMLAPLPLRAGPAEDIARAMDLPRLFAILSREGERYGAELEPELFGSSGNARWAEVITRIHERGRIERAVMARLGQDLAGQEAATARILAYFTAEPGRQIVELELAAREAMLDESVTEAAEASHAAMLEADDPRLAQLDRLVAANDLIEQNVAGALNANLAFYRGMVAGGAAVAVLPDAELMADLWSQEPQYREDTTTWLMAYMVLSYGPLADEQLDSYIAFSLTPEGQLLNRVLFAAFNATFNELSRDIGLAAARLLQGQDI